MNEGAAELGHTVAVVGIGMTTTKISGPQQFWDVLHGTTNTLREPGHFDLDNWYSPDATAPDKTHIRVAGFGLDVDPPHRHLADEVSNGYWRGADRTAMMLRHSILQALDSTCIHAGDRCGAYIGTHPGGLDVEDTVLLAAVRRWLGDTADEALRKRYLYAPEHTFDALPHQMLRTACRDLLPADSDLLVIDTACSSSLYTLDLGAKSLLAGERDIAICGGANTNSRRDLVLFAKLQGLSPHGEVRAFDADASGVLFSDATAVVTLKLLDRAIADGDQILGLLAGFGASADGEGSLMATSSPGQRRAVLRARAVNSVPAEAIDWIVAHGTGSRVGDAEELETLNDVAGSSTVLCTANKPMIGHCAWAAGAINVIHALLAMRHAEIPAERYFSRLPDGVRADHVAIPTQTTPWPAPDDGARLAGVCAYGFGGTNAHLLIQAPDPGGKAPLSATPSPLPATDDPMVLVGTAVHFPGTASSEDINNWLVGPGAPPPRSFGDSYPLPPITELRMPPVSARSVDRTHLMALAVTRNFVAEHGEMWSQMRDTTGVFTGHCGPTRCMTEYTVRVGADDLRAALQSYGASGEQLHVMERELAELSERLPAPNERSMTGQLTNIIGSMVVNRYRLHGMSMNIDCGASSTQGALHVAERYLRSGELDFAIVIGVHGNSTDLVAELATVPVAAVAEGAVLLAVTRRSIAEQQAWPVRAIITTDATRFGQHTGAPAAAGRSYLGADGALATLAVLAGDSRSAAVLRNTDPAPLVQIQPVHAAPHADTPLLPSRSVVALRRRKGEPLAASRVLVTSETLILTHTAELASQLEQHTAGSGVHILCTDAAQAHRGRIAVPTHDDPRSVLEELRTTADAPWQQILIVASARTPSSTWPSPPAPSLTALQEYVLAAAAQLGDAPGPATSIVAVLLDPLRQHAIHPHLTLITGLLRSLAREMPDNPVYSIVTDAALDTALTQATDELSCAREYAVAYYRQGFRYVEQVCSAPLPINRNSNPLPWDDRPVIVATGGARGATAAVVTALAGRTPASLWLLGSTELDPAADDLLAVAEAELNTKRAEFLTRARQQRPQTSLRSLNAEFDALLRTREIRHTLSQLEQLCGSDNVHYVVCDLRDREDVMRAAKAVYSQHNRIDLLIHGAGRIRSAAAPHKQLPDFREIRDIKIAGYHHLKEAFAEPAPTLWCNFGSGNALLGCAGDTDYVPANEYLCAAAPYSEIGEFTVAWGLWTETGMVAHIASQLARDHGFTGMTNRQGAAALLAELVIPRPLDAVPFYGLDTAASGTSETPSCLLGQPQKHSDGTTTWTWIPDRVRDSYLAEHLIDRRPVLPAVMMLAMAAEAAQQLRQDQHVRAFTDLRIEAPVFTDVPVAGCRVVAKTVAPSIVRVELRSDVSTVDGRVLLRDRKHCQLDVHLADVASPTEAAALPSPSMPSIAEDPAVRPDVSAQLSGVWRTLHSPSADSQGASALYRAQVESDSIFANLPFPALLLDSTMRLVGYPPQTDGRQIMAVPRGARRIDIYTHEPDAVLTQHHPGGIQLSYSATNHTATASAGNKVLLTVADLAIHTVDTIPAEIPYQEWQQ